jgi:hypothetical protein
VVVAEEGSLDGGRCAEGVVGLDVSAKRDHDGLGRKMLVILKTKGLDDGDRAKVLILGELLLWSLEC